MNVFCLLLFCLFCIYCSRKEKENASDRKLNDNSSQSDSEDDIYLNNIYQTEKESSVDEEEEGFFM